MNTFFILTGKRRRGLVGLLVVSALGAGGCSTEHSDLKAELAAMTSDVKGRIEPLPPVTPYVPFRYEVREQPDPFGPTKMQLAVRANANSANAPDLKRPREPLEAFALESLQMVGTVQQAGRLYGILRTDRGLYHVTAGNYVGQNFGRVMKVTDGEIVLRELIQDAAGDWTERNTSLMLQESEGKR